MRFACESGDRTDPWAHQQLDALGLFLTAYGTVASAGLIAPDVALVTRFVRYLDAIEYWSRPDLGHWEEWPPKVRTSSLGCVVAGLRAVAPLLASSSGDDGANAHSRATEAEARELAEKGFDVLRPRLGGEPHNPEAWEAEGRADDAAMLTLLLPPIASLLGLTREQRGAIAASALRLRRTHGVLRYRGDSYYGADYQERLRAWKACHAPHDPAAYPHATVRDSWAVDGCEAQWTIFEPLLLLHFLTEHSNGAPRAGDAAEHSLRRILAAVEEKAQLAEAGRPADVRLHVHESYTVVTGQRGPNDVQDLLWAVAYIRMALAVCEETLRTHPVR